MSEEETYQANPIRHPISLNLCPLGSSFVCIMAFSMMQVNCPSIQWFSIFQMTKWFTSWGILSHQYLVLPQMPHISQVSWLQGHFKNKWQYTYPIHSPQCYSSITEWALHIIIFLVHTNKSCIYYLKQGATSSRMATCLDECDHCTWVHALQRCKYGRTPIILGSIWKGLYDTPLS